MAKGSATGGETKDELRAKLEAANRAGLKFARCFQWDREEYHSNERLIQAIEKDEVAMKWLEEVRRESR
jgi:hypothetical protein